VTQSIIADTNMVSEGTKHCGDIPDLSFRSSCKSLPWKEGSLHLQDHSD
jgi:hypothetical protein